MITCATCSPISGAFRETRLSTASLRSMSRSSEAFCCLCSCSTFTLRSGDSEERTQALRGVDLDVFPGEVVVVIGPSGSGKSALLRSINRLETLTSGDIHVDGQYVTDPSVNIRRIRGHVGMVFQAFNLFPNMTALQYLTMAARTVKKRSRNEIEEQARALLKRVGLADKVVFMDEGEIVETGAPAEIFDAPREARTKRFLEHIL